MSKSQCVAGLLSNATAIVTACGTQLGTLSCSTACAARISGMQTLLTSQCKGVDLKLFSANITLLERVMLGCNKTSCTALYYDAKQRCTNTTSGKTTCRAPGCIGAVSALSTGQGNCTGPKPVYDKTMAALALEADYLCGPCSPREVVRVCGNVTAGVRNCTAQCNTTVREWYGRTLGSSKNKTVCEADIKAMGYQPSNFNDTYTQCMTRSSSNWSKIADICVTAFSAAQTACGKSLYLATQCSSATCVAAVHQVKRFHVLCSSDSRHMWPLMEAQFKSLNLIQCPCSDHSLRVYQDFAVAINDSKKSKNYTCTDLKNQVSSLVHTCRMAGVEQPAVLRQ